MNILIFVSILLMVLASISYNEMQIFYRQALSHTAWVRYMDTIEGCLYNNRVEENYDKEPKKKADTRVEEDSLGHQLEKGESEERPHKTQSTGSKRINFRILVGQAKNLTSEKESQFNSLFKNLITELYGNTNFYKTLIKERPDFVDELLRELRSFSDEKKISHAKQLENLELKDAELNKALYFMLKKTPDESNEKDPCAQISLLDFLTDSYRTAIRIYLAPKEILTAIFKDPQIVQQILDKRQALFKLVDKDYPLDKATEDFRLAFESYALFHDIVDFTVTKTNPAKYK